MKKNLKLGLIGALSITMMVGSAMAFAPDNIKDIKTVNKEINKIEIDVYQATQKKAVRAAEINRLNLEVELINNHIQMRDREVESLHKRKYELMTGEVF